MLCTEKNNVILPTYTNFFQHVTPNTYIFWPYWYEWARTSTCSNSTMLTPENVFSYCFIVFIANLNYFAMNHASAVSFQNEWNGNRSLQLKLDVCVSSKVLERPHHRHKPWINKNLKIETHKNWNFHKKKKKILIVESVSYAIQNVTFTVNNLFEQ